MCAVLQAFRLAPLAAGVALLLGACALLDDNVQNVFASRTGAAAMVSGRLLQGQISYTQPRMGTIHLQTPDAPTLACSGTLNLTATSSGVASLSCNNGQSASVPFQLLSPLRAAGRGTMGGASFALTYGLPPEMAAPFLGIAIERLLPPPGS